MWGLYDMTPWSLRTVVTPDTVKIMKIFWHFRINNKDLFALLHMCWYTEHGVYWFVLKVLSLRRHKWKLTGEVVPCWTIFRWSYLCWCYIFRQWSICSIRMQSYVCVEIFKIKRTTNFHSHPNRNTTSEQRYNDVVLRFWCCNNVHTTSF